MVPKRRHFMDFPPFLHRKFMILSLFGLHFSTSLYTQYIHYRHVLYYVLLYTLSELIVSYKYVILYTLDLAVVDGEFHNVRCVYV
jgi:hypothetical protein